MENQSAQALVASAWRSTAANQTRALRPVRAVLQFAGRKGQATAATTRRDRTTSRATSAHLVRSCACSPTACLTRERRTDSARVEQLFHAATAWNARQVRRMAADRPDRRTIRPGRRSLRPDSRCRSRRRLARDNHGPDILGVRRRSRAPRARRRRARQFPRGVRWKLRQPFRVPAVARSSARLASAPTAEGATPGRNPAAAPGFATQSWRCSDINRSGRAFAARHVIVLTPDDGDSIERRSVGHGELPSALAPNLRHVRFGCA